MNNLFALIFCLFIFGVVFLLSAYHNIDIAWNMEWNEYDLGIYGKLTDKNSTYQNGRRELFFSGLLFIIQFLLFIIYI